MARRLIIIISILYLSFLCGVYSYAAYTGNPARIFQSGKDDKKYSFFTEGIADYIYDRKAKYETDDTIVDFYGSAAGIRFFNRGALYGGLGTASVTEEYDIRNTNVKWESDYSFTWLVGGIYKIYETKLEKFYNSRLLSGIDIQYRNTDTEPKKITFDSVVFTPSDSKITHSSMEYNDWHIALTLALEAGVFSPYVGIKYSDFESVVRVTRDNTVFQNDNAEADGNFGIFVGASVNVIDSIFATAEASFIDENSFSGSLSWKF